MAFSKRVGESVNEDEDVASAIGQIMEGRRAEAALLKILNGLYRPGLVRSEPGAGDESGSVGDLQRIVRRDHAEGVAAVPIRWMVHDPVGCKVDSRGHASLPRKTDRLLYPTDHLSRIVPVRHPENEHNERSPLPLLSAATLRFPGAYYDPVEWDPRQLFRPMMFATSSGPRCKRSRSAIQDGHVDAKPGLADHLRKSGHGFAHAENLMKDEYRRAVVPGHQDRWLDATKRLGQRDGILNRFHHLPPFGIGPTRRPDWPLF